MNISPAPELLPIKLANGVEGTVYIPKYRGPIRDNHGDHQILDRRHRQRLKIAAPQNRLVQTDQESDQQNGESHVTDARDNVRRVDAPERRVQQLLEIKHGSMRSLKQ
jgi:hypothetical protein